MLTSISEESWLDVGVYYEKDNIKRKHDQTVETTTGSEWRRPRRHSIAQHLPGHLEDTKILNIHRSEKKGKRVWG